jgi:hypothetical protein
MVKRNIKKKFVTHGKIDFLHTTIVETRRSQGYIIDFGSIKIAMSKNTIDKAYCEKVAFREITTGKTAFFKFRIFYICLLKMAMLKFVFKKVLGTH